MLQKNAHFNLATWNFEIFAVNASKVAMLKKNLLGSDALFGLSLEMKQGTLSKIYKDAAETLQRIEEDERISKS